MSPSSKKAQLYVLLGLIVATVSGIVSGLLGSELEDNAIKKQLGDNYTPILIFLLCILLLATYWVSKRTESLSKEISTTDDNRKELIEGLQRRYNKRLEKKMDSELLFEVNLDLEYTREGTDQSFISEYFIENYHEKSAGGFEQLYDYYLNSLKRLLIIGEPGSGKTVLLLRFAQKLIGIAKQSPDFPVPIILNLSSWRNNSEGFSEWLEQNLVYAAGEYGASKQQAKQLAKSNEILLLLDGLDEIPEMHRASCLRQLSVYLRRISSQRALGKMYPEVLICCRRQEYKSIQENAPVQATVLIRPLSIKSINNAIERIRREQGRGFSADRLSRAIVDQQPVTRLLTNAFFVHLLLKLANEDVDIKAICNPKVLLQVYIQQEMKILSSIYRPFEAYQWLSWLALKLSKSNKNIIFELVDIQPDWLQKKMNFNLIKAICASLLIYIFCVFITGGASLFALGTAIVFFLVLFFNTEKEISTEEAVVFGKFNEKKFFSSLINIMAGSITIILLVLLYFFLKHIPMSELVENPYFTKRIIIGIVVLFVKPLFDGFSEVKNYPRADYPYQRLLKSILFDYKYLMIVFIQLCLISYIQSEIFMINVFWVAIFIILYTVLFASIGSQFVIRFLLWKEKSIPFRLVRFLNTVSSKTGLLEKDGGQWRFRHQLIQDELAKSYLNADKTSTAD